MYASEAECKEAFRKEIMDSFDVEEMFGDMGGGLMSLTSAKL